jgi:hypothetical protein
MVFLCFLLAAQPGVWGDFFVFLFESGAGLVFVFSVYFSFWRASVLGV